MSAHRLVESLEEQSRRGTGEKSRYVVLARELTKTWEMIHGAPIGGWGGVGEKKMKTVVKGEMMIVEGFKAPGRGAAGGRAAYLALLIGGACLEEPPRWAAEIHGEEMRCIEMPRSSK